MKMRFQIAAALALALSSAAAHADTSQLAASAGLGEDAASLLTLTELARIKHNDGIRQQDRVTMFAPVAGGNAAARSQLIASAGIDADAARGMSLTEIAIAKRNHEARRDDDVQVVVSSRSYVAANASGRAQLIASAGLDPAAAQSMTLQAIYVAKINAEGDNQQHVGAY